MEGPLQVRDPMGHAEESVEYGSPAKVGVENVMLRFVTPRRCGNEGLKLVHTGKDAKTDGSSWEPSVRCWIVPRFLILTRLKESLASGSESIDALDDLLRPVAHSLLPAGVSCRLKSQIRKAGRD